MSYDESIRFDPKPVKTTRWDHLLGALLCAIYVAALCATSSDLGMARDEGFYVHAAERYGTWFESFLEDEGTPWDQAFRDRQWEYNHEHPGLVKSLFAISLSIEKHTALFGAQTLAVRFPGILSGGLLLWLIYIFGAQVFGRVAGIFASLAFALLPRVFYQSHLDCFDIPIVLAITFCTYAYWRSLRSRAWAIGAGIAFGLALATKHNAWVLPGIFLIHFAWMSLGHRRQERAGERVPSEVRQGPWWLISFALLGPILFVGTWPWLWSPEFMERLGFYIRFHVSHVHYSIEYFGQTYFEPPFPVHVPFVLTLFTVPLTTLILSLIGAALRSGAFIPQPWAKRLSLHARPDACFTDVLLIGSLLAPLIVIALPSTPIFGGTKHWFPSYPFLALYAGWGFSVLVGRAIRWIQSFDRRGFDQKGRVMLTAASAGLLLTPAMIETAHSHPYGLSHYGVAAGGVPGAADLGMNRQFWGYASAPLNEFFKEQLPDGGSVYLCDMVPIAWEMMQRDGLIPRNIRGTMDLSHADLVMVHHEQHFEIVDAQAWTAFGRTDPIIVLTYDGVPIISVYKNPRSQRAR